MIANELYNQHKYSTDSSSISYIEGIKYQTEKYVQFIEQLLIATPYGREQ